MYLRAMQSGMLKTECIGRTGLILHILAHHDMAKPGRVIYVSLFLTIMCCYHYCHRHVLVLTHVCYMFIYIVVSCCCHLTREREEQRQAKQAAADQSKPKREATADPDLPNQHAHTTPTVLATDVEDSKLPGFAKQPPPAEPIGTGLLSSRQLSGTAHLGLRQHAVVPSKPLLPCMVLRL